MRNKKLLWMLAILILVVSSLVVEAAIGDRLRSLTSSIGNATSGLGGGKGILVIAVNAAIIALLLYLLTTLFKFINPQSKTGKTVLLIVLIIFSIYLSANLSKSPEGNYNFIWSKPVVGELMNYLFNGDTAKGPLGILRPSRILILIGASLVFSWFFTGFLKIGQGNKKFDVALAVLIAAEATRAGMTKGTLIFIGQVIALFMLYTQFKKEQGRHPWVAFIWAYVIQSLVVSAIFKPDDKIWASGILTMIGIPRTAKGFIWLMIGVFAILPTLAMIGVFVSNKEKEAKEEKEKGRWKKDIILYPYAHLLKWLGRSKNPFFRWIFRWWDPKVPIPEREIPFPFRDLRVEFMTLMNYMLRLQVYKAKKNIVSDKQKFMDSDIYSQKGLNQIIDIDKINKNLDVFKNAGRVIQRTSGGKFESEEYEFTDVNGNKFTFRGGFNNTELFIYELVNLLKHFLENFPYKESRRADQIQIDIEKKLNNVDDELASQRARYGIDVTNFKERSGFLKRKGAYNVLELERLFILDQYRLTGKYDHTYRFARKDAKIYNAMVGPQEISPENTFLRKAPTILRVVPSSERVTEPYKVEVDGAGYFVEDLNSWILEGGNIIRKIDPEEIISGQKVKNIIEHNQFNDATKWLEAEWELFIRDVLDGRFHQRSRSAKDYADRHARKEYNYDNLKPSGKIGRDNPAFDRQALLNPTFDYLGRRKVDGVDEDSVPVTAQIEWNKSPCISTLGIKQYILTYLESKMVVDEEFRNNVSGYVYDTGLDEGDVFTNMPHESKSKNG